MDTHLQTLLPEWATNADRTQLHRTLKLRNFRGAMAYINRIAELAEAEGHHPDMTVRSWNVVDVVLWTHKTGGVTDNDVIMAVKIDAMSPVVEK